MITDDILHTHNLTRDEYDRIVKAIGRAPNLTELGIFSVMWSEHCSYKSSRKFLRNFPTTGPQVIQGPGENAGVIDFTDELAIVFKMESHNHPSFIEPHHGAATGVGGILRDVFTMGARPIAILDSLRFGEVSHPRTPYLVNGVVGGIGSYGNCMGIPTVGGEVSFAPCYNGDILVNAMALGIARKDGIFYGKAAGVGNPVIYVGAKTGRDGIHGATMASAVFGEGNESRRPTVQVGDPFVEKLLLEACQEAFAPSGGAAGDAILGIQDMGAAGLTSSSFEMAARAGSGIRFDLDKVPCRETAMTPYEIMLSESQERMLMVVTKGRESEIAEIFAKWELSCVTIGEVTDTGRVQIFMRDECVVDLPVAPIVDEAPVYDRPRRKPAWLEDLQSFDLSTIPQPDNNSAVLLQLLASPNLASKRSLFRRYDAQVGTNTVVLPGSDAAVLRVRGTKKGIAISTDCNSRYCYLDPYFGAAHAVAEAARNVVCSGATPQALTDCLNFGNPENPEIMWQFEQAVLGMSAACRELGTPVVSGNVSLYNETNGESIYPTPMVGMVGVLDDVAHHTTQWFTHEDDAIVLLGDLEGELGASEYLAVIHGTIAGAPPALDLAKERVVQTACLAAIHAGFVHSAHDCADGGLAVALAECCMSGPAKIGARVQCAIRGTRRDRILFGEAPARIILSLAAKDLPALKKIAEQHHVPFHELGMTGGNHLHINDWIDLPVMNLFTTWDEGFEKALAR